MAIGSCDFISGIFRYISTFMAGLFRSPEQRENFARLHEIHEKIEEAAPERDGHKDGHKFDPIDRFHVEGHGTHHGEEVEHNASDFWFHSTDANYAEFLTEQREHERLRDLRRSESEAEYWVGEAEEPANEK